MTAGRLHDRVALIVGGGADGPPAKGESLPIGNGRATAIQCAREGARVVVADRDLHLADQTVTAIEAEGNKAVAVACDVLSAEDCQRAVNESIAAFGALHLLVNNVGIADLGNILQTDVDEFDRVVATNLRSQFLMIKHALPVIADSGGGAIVNVSSLNALRSGIGVGYECSKAALFALTRNVALTAGPMKVRVNTMVPGVIDSTILRRYLGDAEFDRSADIPLGRQGTPWDVAKAIVFLLSDDAAYISGTHLLVDGAMAVPL